ncbi:MAG: phenylacetate--CoA ligase family protein [Patescibacteria group bacterium]|nr:phenylacetate--CoA ligase family protein [Patescibacteria group bacterium]
MNNKEDKKAAEKTIKRIKDKNSYFWQKRAEEVSLELFYNAAEMVPAYKDFLRKNKINSSKIRNFKDFKSVPPTSKENYLRQYPLEDLTWKGHMKKSLVFSSTSGSTGTPFYFPRNHILDWQSSIYHQIFLENSHIDPNRSTLVLVCFGMGVWVGGIITYHAFKLISDRGYPLAIITPGVNKKQIFEALKNIGPKFDQIILCGYPPFMKDVVDEAESQGVKWKDYNTRIIFAAESFSEKFREYIIDKMGIQNIHTGTMNIYGSADIGTMAIETPMNIMMRRMALERKEFV